jgi:5'-nucleotidase / UDP-sugar diphosphatase
MNPGQTRRTATALLWGLSVLVSACTTPSRLVILHFNDFHGQVTSWQGMTRPGRPSARVGGFVAVSDYVRRTREAAGADSVVWLTDGGDWFQGTPEGNEDHGWSLMACRNRLGFTAVTVGNHEYDYGEANLIRLIRRAEHPVLAANIHDGHGAVSPYVKPYRIETIGNMRIAIVGLIAADTRNVSTGPFGDAEFGDEIATVGALLPQLERVADAVVLLTHCGIRKDEELARAFPSIALILGGHSHTALPRGRKIGDTWIVQSAGRGASVSRVEVTLHHGPRRFEVRSARLVPIPALEKGHPETVAFLDRTFRHIGPVWDRPVGRIEGVRDRGLRRPFSSPSGNYIAGLIKRVGAADIGLMNKGGIRTTLAPGPITRRQVFELLPFDNTVSVMEMSGVQLRTLLGQGLRPGRQPLEIAGGRYAFRVVGGRRELVSVTVEGRPLDADRRYRVATNSFLASGGDGFTQFSRVTSRRASAVWLRAAMLAELTGRGSIRLVADARIRLVE